MKPFNYYAVIFSSQRSDVGAKEYEKMSELMHELAKKKNGFLGVESARPKWIGHHGFLLVNRWRY
jgi:heme-degrading monooxygenase HmoA